MHFCDSAFIFKYTVSKCSDVPSLSPICLHVPRARCVKAVLKIIPIDWPDRENDSQGQIREYDLVLISQSTSINYPRDPKLSQSSFLAGDGAVFSEIPRSMRYKKGKGNVNT